MNKILLVIYILKLGKQIEVIFDERLSFNDNLMLLNELYCVGNIDAIKIFDGINAFYKKDVPIKNFEFKQFEKIYLL